MTHPDVHVHQHLRMAGRGPRGRHPRAHSARPPRGAHGGGEDGGPFVRAPVGRRGRARPACSHRTGRPTPSQTRLDAGAAPPLRFRRRCMAESSGRPCGRARRSPQAPRRWSGQTAIPSGQRPSGVDGRHPEWTATLRSGRGDILRPRARCAGLSCATMALTSLIVASPDAPACAGRVECATHVVAFPPSRARSAPLAFRPVTRGAAGAVYFTPVSDLKPLGLALALPLSADAGRAPAGEDSPVDSPKRNPFHLRYRLDRTDSAVIRGTFARAGFRTACGECSRV